MTTANKTWTWNAGFELWSFSAGNANVTGGFDGAYGNAAGSLYFNAGPAKNIPTNVSTLEIVGTWAGLFGISSDSVVTQIQFNSGDRRCTIFAGIINNATIGPIELYDNVPTLQATLKAGYQYLAASSGWDAWGAGTVQDVPSAIQAANNTIRIRVSFTSNTGNDKASNAKVYFDNMSFTITYGSGVQNNVVRNIISNVG